MFSRNVGGIDRALRIVLGLVFLPAGLILLASGRELGWAVAAAGALILATGALGFCPPYVFLGISTAKRRGTAGRCAPGEAPGSR